MAWFTQMEAYFSSSPILESHSAVSSLFHFSIIFMPDKMLEIKKKWLANGFSFHFNDKLLTKK